MKYKNYIFDFDGTLMDTAGVILKTIQTTIRTLGLPPRSDEQCRSIIGIRTDEAGHHLYPDSPVSDKEFAAAFRANYADLKKNAHEEAFPGVIDKLRELRSAGCGLAIASSRRLDSLHDYLRGLGIEELFDMIIGADSVVNGKPNPEPVLRILDAMGWEAAESLVVGDADVDIMMGNGAGCATCAVTYGNGSLPSLEASRPVYIIDSIAELP